MALWCSHSFIGSSLPAEESLLCLLPHAAALYCSTLVVSLRPNRQPSTTTTCGLAASSVQPAASTSCYTVAHYCSAILSASSTLLWLYFFPQGDFLSVPCLPATCTSVWVSLCCYKCLAAPLRITAASLPPRHGPFLPSVSAASATRGLPSAALLSTASLCF